MTVEGWVIPPAYVLEHVDGSMNVGVWQKDWYLEIRSGCCASRMTDTGSYIECDTCLRTERLSPCNEFKLSLNFGAVPWNRVSVTILQWTTYWVGVGHGMVHGKDTEVWYNDMTWEDYLEKDGA